MGYELRTAVPDGVDDRRQILLYERACDRRSSYSFHRSYAGLAVDTDFSDVRMLPLCPLEARVLRPRPA